MDASSPHVDVSVSKALSTLRPISLTGLFGGDRAVAAMGTVHLFARRWICGWYNTPGSYEIAKRYGQLANVWFWDGLFPGGTHDPSELFKVNGQKGPPFLGAHSDSKYSHTGHLAYLLARKARYMANTFTHPINDTNNLAVLKSVTVFDLRAARLPVGKDLSAYLQTGRPVYMSLLVLFVNLLLATLSWSNGDGLCAFIICLGIAANGIACLVLGWGTLAFHGHVPAEGAPPGDGILYNDDGVLILLGGEPVVSSILRGRFFVRYSRPTFPFQCPAFVTDGWEAIVRRFSPYWRRYYRDLPFIPTQDLTPLMVEDGASRNPESSQEDATPRPALEHPSSSLVACCAFLLMVQFIAQLVIIPLGTPSGQVLFILSLATSWLYNAYLASHDREDIQTEILLKMLGIEQRRICKIRCDFRTSMAVFTALVLQAHARAADPKAPTPPATSASTPFSSAADPPSDVVPSCEFLPYADCDLKVVGPTGRSLRTSLPNPMKVLSGILPNDTKVWNIWKKQVAQAVNSKKRPNEEVSFPNLPNTSEDYKALTEEERLLLDRLYGYAGNGQKLYMAWLQWCHNNL